MSARKHRSRSERAICPQCGRNTAAMFNADMTLQRMQGTYLLHPHNIAPGQRCKGWIVGKEDMVPRAAPARRIRHAEESYAPTVGAAREADRLTNDKEGRDD